MLKRGSCVQVISGDTCRSKVLTVISNFIFSLQLQENMKIISITTILEILICEWYMEHTLF